jgi:hypothetical protein
MAVIAKKTIPARRIAYYAKICASHNRLEKLRYKVRDELLVELDAGAIPATSGPYLLVKTFQSRIDAKLWSWKSFAMELAMRLGKALGYDETKTIRFAMGEILQAELAAKRNEVPVLQAKTNPEYQGPLKVREAAV